MAGIVLPSDRAAQGAQSSTAPRPAQIRILPSEPRKVQQPSAWTDVLKSAGAGAAKGLIGLAGLPGDIQDAAHWIAKQAVNVPRAGYRYATGESPTIGEAYRAASQATENEETAFNKRRSARVPKFPGSADLVNAANRGLNRATGYQLYDPQTMAGRLTQDVTSAAAPGLIGKERLLANLAKNAPGAIASGLAGGVTREALENASPGNSYVAPASIAASLAAGHGVAGLQAAKRYNAPAAVAQRGKQLAGNVLREADSAPKPGPHPMASVVGNAVQKPDMAAATGATPDMHLDASRTLHAHLNNVDQAMRNREKAAWDLVDKEATLKAAPVMNDINDFITNGLSTAQRNSIPGKIKTTIAQLGKGFVPGENGEPLTEIAGGVKYTFDPKDQTWRDPAGNVNPGVSRALDSVVPKAAEGDLPINELQGLRSATLDYARAAKEAGRSGEAVTLGNLAEKMGNHLENPDSYNFKSGDVTENWRRAIDATRERKTIFGSGFPADVVAKDLQGRPTMAPEATLDALINGKNAAQTLRNLRNTPQLNTDLIDQTVSDWAAGKLTKNGSNPDVAAKDVDAFLANPKNSAILGEVPAARSRVENIGSAAASNDNANRLDKVTEGFRGALDKGPKAVSKFMGDNKQDILDATLPENHADIEQFHTLSNVAKDAPESGITSSPALSAIKDKNLLSYVYGKPAGAASVAGSAAGALATGHQLASMAGLHGVAGAAAPAVMAIRQGLRPAVDYLGKPLMGSTGKAALGELEGAVLDPAKVAELKAQPDIRFPLTMGNMAGAMAPETARQAAYVATRPEEHKREEPKPELQFKPMDLGAEQDVPLDALHDDGQDFDVPLEAISAPDEQRPARKSGGRTGEASKKSTPDVDFLVQRLMHHAKNAKRDTDKTTEPLLGVDDKVIARALAVAKRSI